MRKQMSKMMFDTTPEVEKLVYEKYPIKPKEKRCAIERQKREYLRAEERKRILGANMKVTEESWEK
jgi:hypothetical protein